MPQLGLIVLVHVFSALLPPVDPDETTYYEILNVPNKSSSEDIRKAYKKLSLKLHPDKVAQRGGVNAEEAAKEYEKVQEAYGVLANEQKRATYDALKTPTRYRFYSHGALANPGALYENLTSASFIDKTRLVGVVTVLILIILLQPILICAKVNQDLEQGDGKLTSASWFAIFTPYWIVGGLIMLLTALLVPFVSKSDRPPLCLSVLEQFFWYLSMIFLCFRWDQTWDSPYRQIFTPVYIAMLLRWIQAFVMLRKVRKDVQRMVTVDYLEKEVLKEKTLEDLEESELKELQEAYLVVTVPPDFVPYHEEGVELDDEKIEEQKVEASHEFEAATEIYNKTVTGVANSIVFGTIFLILLTRKLDGKIDASWWVVFIPVFLERGFRWLLNFYHCICGRVIGDEIIVEMSNPTAAEGDKEKDEGAEKEKETNDGDKKSDKGSEQAKNAEISEEDEFVQNPPADETKTTEDDSSKPKSAKATSSSNKSSDKKSSKTDTNEERKDGDENIHIDEETFHAWQNAYEQAEESAMQEQAKASSECCNLSLQLILLCLVVAKIEKSYESDDPNDVGFSMFWILFPFFLFFGIICCCCTLLIYGASPGSAADLNGTTQAEEHHEHDPENPPVTPDSKTSTAPAIIVPPPTEEEKKDNVVESKNSSNEVEAEKDKTDDVGVEVEATEEGETKANVEENMDDLD